MGWREVVFGVSRTMFAMPATILLVLLATGFAWAANRGGGNEEGEGVEFSAMEEEIRRRINRIREERNLPPLTADPVLARLAREYSRRMAEEGFFSHADPAGGSIDDRLRIAGVSYRVAGENIFRSENVPNPGEAAVQGWMKSPGHRENILRAEFRETGIGLWRAGNTFYITQLFLKRR